MNLRTSWSIGLVFCAVACAGPKSTYTVEITNGTPTIISAALVKQAPPGVRLAAEDGWAAPEDVAFSAPELLNRHWGAPIPPGKTCIFGPIEGHFPEGIDPAVRAYSGDHTVLELVSFSRGDPDRLDLRIPRGRSTFIIRQEDGRLMGIPNGVTVPANGK